jgi:hypothetical protein
MTWRDLIKLALQDLRIYGAVGNVSAEDEALATAHLNDWLDAQQNDLSAVSEIRRTTWVLTAAASYAVGIGAAVNVQRPVSPQAIAGVGFIDGNMTGSPEIAVNPPLNPSEWQSIAYKSFSSPQPSGWYYEATTPTGTLSPYPVPSSGTLQGVMYSAVSVAEVTNLAAVLVLQPGMRLWLRKALKIELVDPFRVPVGEQTLLRWKQERDDAAANVGRMNERLEEVSFGAAGALFGGRRGPGNVYTGQ